MRGNDARRYAFCWEPSESHGIAARKVDRAGYHGKKEADKDDHAKQRARDNIKYVEVVLAGS